MASASGPVFPSLHRSFQVKPQLPPAAGSFFIVAFTAQALRVREDIAGAAFLSKRYDMVVLCVARVWPAGLWVDDVFTIAVNAAHLAHPTVAVKNRLAGAFLVVWNFKQFALLAE